MRYSIVVIWLALAPTYLTAQTAREFGAARYAPPVDFVLDDKPSVQTYSRARGRELCLILLSREEPAPSALDVAFRTSWQNAFPAASYRRNEVPAVSIAVSPSGYRHVVGEGDLEDARGNRFIARLHVFPVGTKGQSILWIGNSREALLGCKPEWDAFFASLEFPTVQAAAISKRPSADTSTPVAPPEQGRPALSPAPTSPTSNTVDASRVQQFGNGTFVVPRGWNVSRAGNAVHLTPPRDRPEEFLQISLLGGRPVTSGMPNEYAVAWNELQALLGAQPLRSVNGGIYDLDEPARSLAGWEYLHGTGGMRRGDGTYTVDLYLIRAGNRAERVAVISRDFRDNASGGVMVTASTKPAWRRAMFEFLARLRFTGDTGRTSVPARIESGGITGVWNGIAMSFGSLKTQFAIFFDNGVAYLGPLFPLQGLSDIDPTAEQLASRRYWGTYTFANGQGMLTMPYGSIPLRSDVSTLVLTTNNTPHRFIRRVIPPLLRLDGTWCLAGGPCMAFTPGGRFEENGAVRVLEHATYAYPESPARGVGRYELRDYTLILRYDTGQEMRIGFPGFLDNAASAPRELTLGFNADVLTRR